MNKEITVEQLVKEFRQFKNEDFKKTLVRKYVPENTYIPYASKCFLANTIVNQSVLNGKVVRQDSTKKYILYMCALVNEYTKIQVTAKNWTDEYDKLEQNGIMDIIIELIPEKEKSAFTTILNMKVDDAICNNVTQKDMVIGMLQGMMPNMGDMGEVFENMTDEQFGQILEFAKKEQGK